MKINCLVAYRDRKALIGYMKYGLLLPLCFFGVIACLEKEVWGGAGSVFEYGDEIEMV